MSAISGAGTLAQNVSIPTALQRYVAKWALAGESDRINVRRASSSSELLEFYNAGVAEFDHLVALVGDKSLDELAGDELKLFQLLLSFVEVSQTVEVFGADRLSSAYYPEELLKCVPRQ